MDIFTTRQVADALGIDPSRVRAIARARGRGILLHRRERVFTPADVDAMRERRGRGRPKRDP